MVTKVDDGRGEGKQPQPATGVDWFDDDDGIAAEMAAADAEVRSAQLQRLKTEDPTRWLVASVDPSEAEIDEVAPLVLADVATALRNLGGRLEPFGEAFWHWLRAFEHGSEQEFDDVDRLIDRSASLLREGLRALSEQPIDPSDYAAIRLALERADASNERVFAFAGVRIALERRPKPTRFARDLKDLACDIGEALSGARFADEAADGASNRQRAALRVLLSRAYGLSASDANRFVKNVFDAPAKSKRRAAQKARKR